MSALPLSTDDLVGEPSVARAPRRTRETLTAPLRLAPPVAPAPRETRPVRPGWDMVEVDPRLRHDVERWVQRYAQAALEIVAGERPPAQLTRWTRRSVHLDLTRRAQLAMRAVGQLHPAMARRAAGHPRPQVHSVRVSFLAQDVVEAAVHVRHGDRSRAMAARFEWRRGRWICTALEFC